MKAKYSVIIEIPLSLLFTEDIFQPIMREVFFVEGFGMLHTYENETYDFVGNGSSRQENQTDFAVGISAGAKFITKRGFTAEIYLGIGRNIGGESDSIEAVGRGGISLGYRF